MRIREEQIRYRRLLPSHKAMRVGADSELVLATCVSCLLKIDTGVIEVSAWGLPRLGFS